MPKQLLYEQHMMHKNDCSLPDEVDQSNGTFINTTSQRLYLRFYILVIGSKHPQ